MADEPFASEPDASRPRLPWILFAISTIVAVLATTGFVYLITTRTTGPAEVLRAYYRNVTEDDCEAAYAMLAATPQEFPLQPEWCEEVFPQLDLSPTFRVDSITLDTEQDFASEEPYEVATVDVIEPNGDQRSWRLLRGEDSWRIAGQGIPDPSPLRPPETPAA